MIFRTYRDKRRAKFCKLLRQFWNEMPYEKQEKFRKDYFGLYLTIMCLIDWNGEAQ